MFFSNGNTDSKWILIKSCLIKGHHVHFVKVVFNLLKFSSKDSEIVSFSKMNKHLQIEYLHFYINYGFVTNRFSYFGTWKKHEFSGN